MLQLMNRFFLLRNPLAPICASLVSINVYNFSLPSEDCKIFEARTKNRYHQNFSSSSLYGKEKLHRALLWSPGIHSWLPLLSGDSNEPCREGRAGRSSPIHRRSRKWLGRCALENARNFPIVPPISHLITWRSTISHTFLSIFEGFLFGNSLLFLLFSH